MSRSAECGRLAPLHQGFAERIMAGPVGEWYKDANDIDGVLLDIYGVLYEDGGEGPVAIQGSVEAINK